MRVCYILSSVPGSGKTTWALNFKATHLNTFIVSSDEIRKELGGSYQYFKEEERVWRIFLLEEINMLVSIKIVQLF